MILADENVDHAIIEALIEKGIEVYSIYAMRRGLSDKEIITLSRNPPRIILTEDKDFGEWVFAHKESDISVILLRYDYINLASIASIVTRLILEHGPELYGKFVTVTIHKIRIRSIK